MLVKYKYTYNIDGYVYHRGSANRTKSTKHSCGIVFAVCRGGFFGDELGCFDISMERIKRYLDGFEIVDEFLPQIPFSDVEIVRDDFSQDWQTKYSIPYPALGFEVHYSVNETNRWYSDVKVKNIFIGN